MEISALQIFNIALCLVLALLSLLYKQLLSRVKTTEDRIIVITDDKFIVEKLDTVAKELADFKLLAANTYPTKPEINIHFERQEQTFKEIKAYFTVRHQ